MRYSIALLVMVAIDLLYIAIIIVGMIALGWGLWQLGLDLLWCALISAAAIIALSALFEKLTNYRRASRRLARSLVGLPEYLPASGPNDPEAPTNTELRRAAFWTALGLSALIMSLVIAAGVYFGGALLGAGAIGIGLLIFGWLFLHGGVTALLDSFEQRLLEDSELRRDGPGGQT